MHFPCSDTWLEGLLADDCPGLDLTVELLGIAAASGVMRFAPKADCTISGVEEAGLLLRKCGLSVSRTAANGDRLAAGRQCLEATRPRRRPAPWLEAGPDPDGIHDRHCHARGAHGGAGPHRKPRRARCRDTQKLSRRQNHLPGGRHERRGHYSSAKPLGQYPHF
jgi:Nicotinate-nucleotide pyrophosphorylase